MWLCHLHLIRGTTSNESVGALICVALILLLWLLHFTSKWVRVAADAYAERLIETVDSVESGAPSSKGQARKKTA
jgi:hypothetical protein